MPGSSGQPRESSLFFFSYAHAHWDDPADQRDADYWVDRFHGRLCAELEKIMEPSQGRNTGFIDRRMKVGDNWQDEVAERLAHCAVFVPLYTKRYFRSQECGREWSVIRQRQDMHVAAANRCPNIVIPVLWEPLVPEDMPTWVRSIHYQSEDLGDTYHRKGLEGLSRLQDYRHDYEAAVKHIARRIADVAQGPEQLRPLYEVPKFRQLPDAFAADGNPSGGNGSVRITVAALSTASRMPDGRGGEWYGDSAMDWCPYRDPDSRGLITPLAWRASDVAQRREYDTEVTVLNPRSEEVRGAGAPSAPTLMLVDPWSTLDETWQGLLRRLDNALRTKPWVRIILPWNAHDVETVANSVVLHSGIERTFGRSLALGRILPRRGELGPSSSAAFGPAVSEAIRVAQTEFAKNTHKFLPPGPYPGKPRLRGPGGGTAPRPADGPRAGEDSDDRD
ncbi:MAG: TIR-like protein FxsC [Actinocrinis sp.]